ncbi:hypothetical protein NPIL_650561 [Nephila pilipes]|uniref:Uncharacterized protein n=1 Tax=Nephila pilipes TaxID=299642 RepID=A0A8X6Q3K1_NEPPI|nr:hypothetical protein NPIL_650561 [Nephila pilipes]
MATEFFDLKGAFLLDFLPLRDYQGSKLLRYALQTQVRHSTKVTRVLSQGVVFLNDKTQNYTARLIQDHNRCFGWENWITRTTASILPHRTFTYSLY